MLIPSVLLSLVLVAPAEATNVPKIKNIRIRQITTEGSTTVSYRTSAVSVTTTPDVTAVVADVESDAGSEELILVEGNVLLHGTAESVHTFGDDARGTIILYDTENVAIAEVAVAVAPGTRAQDSAAVGDLVVSSRAVATDEGVEFRVDLSGVDALDVAYASITVEDTVTKEVCYAYDKSGACIKGESVTTVVSTTNADVAWSDLEIVWEAEPSLDHEGEVVVKATTRDARGKKIETAKAKLAPAWTDGGVGQGALTLDEDPLTTTALISDQFHAGGTVGFLVHSDGWSAEEELPEWAEITLDGGETWTVPANSVQVAGSTPITTKQMANAAKIVVIVKHDDADSVANVTVSPDAPPVCVDGVCVSVSQGADGGWDLSATAYGEAVSDLPVGGDFAAVLYDAKGNKLDSEDLSVTYDPEVSVVFGIEATFGEDPVGLDVTGTVKLQGAANAKGRRDTLARGKFFATVCNDEDGDLAFAGKDKDVAVARGDILIGGEPIGFERTVDTDGDGVIEAPPAVSLRVESNGKGTRNVATTTSGKPGLL